MKLSFQKLFFILAFLLGVFAIMVFAKAILIPLSMALFISFILLPVVQKLERWGLNKLLAGFLSLLMILMIVGGGITLFSAEIISLSEEVNDFTGKLMNTLSDVILFINNNVGFIDDLSRDELVKSGKDWFRQSSGLLIQNAFSSTAVFFTGLLATIIFTFLFLIYREGLTNAFVSFGSAENKGKIYRMLKNIQCIGKKYLFGMLMLVLILGFASSIGLWIIGIDSPFLFGFLAATLAFVPYIGTVIGATIPILYAFMRADSLWTPLAVIILFWVIQIVESNFLSPKIVGRSLNVNALVAILSLLVGASMWGIAGMVLFLPFVAILKVICEEFEQLKPIAMLISSDIGDYKEGEKSSKWIEKIKIRFKKK
ncbi:MAG: AI-2E family transporter [Flavobacteriales bacterium]